MSDGDRLRTQRIKLHGRSKTTRVLLLLQVLAEDDENCFGTTVVDLRQRL